MEALTGDDIVAFEPDNEQDEQGADDATKYVSHLIFERNNGFTTLYDAIKSCLIARMGVVKVYCDKSSVEKEETYQGVRSEEHTSELQSLMRISYAVFCLKKKKKKKKKRQSRRDID